MRVQTFNFGYQKMILDVGKFGWTLSNYFVLKMKKKLETRVTGVSKKYKLGFRVHVLGIVWGMGSGPGSHTGSGSGFGYSLGYGFRYRFRYRFGFGFWVQFGV